MNRLSTSTTLGATLALMTACAGTRPTDIGVENGVLTPCPSSPNCVSSGNEDASHKVDALALAVPPEQAWQAVRVAVEALPGTVVVDASDDYLHAESTSALMGYVDDLELHLAADGRRIDVRSASRIGYGDGGVNRARVEALREALVKAGIVVAPK